MNTNKHPTVRIFISSPGDVHEERKQACRVVENLQRKYPDANLVTVLWENLPLPSTATFQESIDILLNQQPIDIAIFILWSRLGTPIGPQIARPDGSSYRSGTEREFDLMLGAYQSSGDKKRPMILTYTRNDDEGLMERVKSAPKAEREEILSQSKLADEFIRENFKDAQGRNLRAYFTYPKPITFAQRLHAHLNFQLSEMLVAEMGPIWPGEPYRGLQFFDIEHGPIFKGRDQETCEVLERLQSRLQAGCGGVVILGASGSGKSSLARAGVAATLQHHAYDSGVKEWRVASLIPGRDGADLFAGLTREIAAAILDPENSPSMLDDLAAALTDASADKAVRLGVNLMFQRAAKRAQGVVRLLLIIDQLEELWTDDRITPAVRKQFLTVILALAKSGHIALLLTLRSDFYSEAQQSEEFLALKEGQGHYDLLPPGPEVLHRLITEPARLAGLRFEQDPKTGRILDQEIAKAAAGGRIALPLLQDALSELYQKRDGRRNLLTLEAYDELGGLAGAIGRRAEKVVSELPPAVGATLPDVMRRLAVLREGSEETFTAARVDINQVATTPAQRALVDALVEARLLVIDKTESDITVGLAHEALLTYWPRLKQLLEEDREFLRVRQRIKSAADRWRQEKQSADYLLPSGKPLAEGRDLFSRRRKDLDKESTGFIALSILREESTRRTRRIVIAVASLAFLLVCVISSVAFYIQKSRAETQRTKAIASEELAQRNLALVRVNLASQTWKTGDVGRARKFLQDTPKERRDWEWRYVQGLCDRNRLTIPIGWPMISISFSPGGDSLLVGWTAPKPPPLVVGDPAKPQPLFLSASGFGSDAEHGGVQLWGLSTASRLMEVSHPDGAAIANRFVALEGDGTQSGLHIVSVSRSENIFSNRSLFQEGVGPPSTYQLQLWKTGSSEPIRSRKVEGHFVAIRRDGYVAVAMNVGDKTKDGSLSKQVVDGLDPFRSTAAQFRVHNLGSDGGEVASFQAIGAGVTSLLFHPDGKQLISSHQDGVIHFWDIQPGALRASLPTQFKQAELCAISADGNTLAISGMPIAQDRSSLEIWDLDPIATIPRRTIQIDVSTTKFALDKEGYELAAGGWDNTVRVWDTRSGEQTHLFRGHSERVTDVAFHPQDAILASCSKDGRVKLWDLKVRDQRATVLSAPGRVIRKLALPDVGPHVVLIRDDRSVELWNTSTANRQLEVKDGVFAAISPQGDVLATGEQNDLVLRFLGSSEPRIIRCVGHQHEVSAAAFSRDGGRVVSVDEKGNWIVWRVTDGAKERQQPELTGFVSSNFGAAFSPDGGRLLACDFGNSLFVWDIRRSPSEKAQWDTYELSGMLAAAGISEDGKRIVALGRSYGDEPAQLRVWEPGKSEPLFTHPVAAGFVNGAAISPNGKRLFTAISDKGVQVWDVDSGLEILTLTDFGEDARELVLSASGHRLAGIQAKTQTIKIWDASP